MLGIARFWASVLLVLMLLTACVEKPVDEDPERARLRAIAERVQIQRDDFGVPHIRAKTNADAVFGLLYAQAEDDFPRIERNYIWAIGRLAEVQGEQAVYSDVRARLYMSQTEAEAAYAEAPAWLRALCDAFADGLNYYLLSNPQVRPELLDRFEPWMPFYFFEGSIGGDIEQIPLPGIEAFYADAARWESALPAIDAPLQPWQAAPQVAASFFQFDEPSGSNGFAIGPSLSASGNPLLMINPHTSFFFRGEVHVTSDEGLDAYGAVTWGQFFIYQGFNAHNGWMHTSTQADFMDEFVLDVRRDGDALVYRFGDEWRPVQRETITLRVRSAQGGYTEREFPRYRTHQGPVTHQLDERWVATRINWDPLVALQQSWQRQITTSYDEFRAMMDLRTNSSNNTVYADRHGNIAYFHGNFMPRRHPEVDYSQPVDGSEPENDWQGLHSVDEMISLLNPASGWIQNANSTPFTAAGASSPSAEDYPLYMAPDPENHRGVNAVRLLSQASDLTIDTLIELAYDPYLAGFERLIGGLLEAYDEAPEAWPQLAEATAVLRDWDLTVSAESQAMTLAHFYGMNALERIPATEALSPMARIDWLGTGSDPAQRLQVFAQTLEELTQDFGDWRQPWAEVNRYQRLDGAIDQRFDDAEPSLPVAMASGQWGALAAYGAARKGDVKRLYGHRGNSFVAAVEFGDRVRAKSIMAGGQSGDPASPHFADQAQRYVDRAFKDVAFYPEDVERRAVRRYRPGTN